MVVRALGAHVKLKDAGPVRETVAPGQDRGVDNRMETAQATSPPPLAGVRVLDLATMLAGPLICQLLGDFGAEVIKGRAPGRGRRLTGPWTGQGRLRAVVEGGCRNKSSIGLYLGDPDCQDILLKLVERADVVVRASGPGRSSVGVSATTNCDP